MKIRKMQENDLKEALELFYSTVHTVNAPDYKESELDAWAPKDLSELKEKLNFYINDGYAFIATIDDQLVGFMTMSRSGFLDHAYVHKNFLRQGIFTALFSKCRDCMQKIGISEIHTYASITAKKAFEKLGFYLVAKNTTLCRGIYLQNYHLKLKI
jgi:putative acetyltransferase